ncbi:6960_t:CDS:2 [Diversispora eburnea]|uniref:6960_t:CDS:1 n=1 Tax=Diversispora eburnea TaxID=1213867 RepID=A0A9N8V842_9GLOM|nr:6960_t:CDS:2 [Diversispora eburnea]
MSEPNPNKQLNRDSYQPLNVKGLNITAEAKAKGEGTSDTLQRGGLGKKHEEKELGLGDIPRNRGKKMREEKEFEEVREEVNPNSNKLLEPPDGELFEYFLFGGILDRTSELRNLNFQTRNLGNLQMTTDTAIHVTKRIVEDKGDAI